MMTAKSIELGSVVLMTAGRESGQYFIVVDRSPGYILAADGRKRTVQHPKRKNIRHVQYIQAKPTVLEAACMENRPFRDEEIRAAITQAQTGKRRLR